MKDLGVVNFPELFGTGTVSHRLFVSQTTLKPFFFWQNGPEHANTQTLY